MTTGLIGTRTKYVFIQGMKDLVQKNSISADDFYVFRPGRFNPNIQYVVFVESIKVLSMFFLEPNLKASQMQDFQGVSSYASAAVRQRPTTTPYELKPR